MDPSDQGPWPPTKDMCLDLVYVNLGAGTHATLAASDVAFEVDSI